MPKLTDIDELTRIMKEPHDPHPPGFDQDEGHEGNGKGQVDVGIGCPEERE